MECILQWKRSNTNSNQQNFILYLFVCKYVYILCYISRATRQNN